MRNVPDVDMALAEQQRVLKDGGRVVSLDTTPPRRNLLQPFLKFHLHRVVPLLGRIIAGDSEAYTYLPDSTEQFLTAEKLAKRMGAAGFQAVDFVRRMFGTVAIHWGRKDS
jgi:demethylmenaquinone methyltransferase/2-methoxy-6-polyprenyl-1,4-benzoquinol methylase